MHRLWHQMMSPWQALQSRIFYLVSGLWEEVKIWWPSLFELMCGCEEIFTAEWNSEHPEQQLHKLTMLPKTSHLQHCLLWSLWQLADWYEKRCPLCLLRRKLHQQFELYKDQVKKLGEESQVAQMARAESPTCGVCRKTKFADGCGRACCYCQSRFCARCGGRVPLRANKVSVCMQPVGCRMCVNTDRCIKKSSIL